MEDPKIEEGESSARNPKVLGQDLSKIPCFRRSFLYSITGGIGGGLTYFLFTSNTRKSFHAAFGTYAVTFFGVYIHCMHNYAKEKMKLKMINETIHEMRTKSTSS